MLTKTIFAQCKIILEGSLIVSNLKMINKLLTLPSLEKFLRTSMNHRAFSLSLFRAFTHYECLFPSVLLISVAKETESTSSLLLFHQNYLQ